VPFTLGPADRGGIPGRRLARVVVRAVSGLNRKGDVIPRRWSLDLRTRHQGAAVRHGGARVPRRWFWREVRALW